MTIYAEILQLLISLCLSIATPLNFAYRLYASSLIKSYYVIIAMYQEFIGIYIIVATYMHSYINVANH